MMRVLMQSGADIHLQQGVPDDERGGRLLWLEVTAPTVAEVEVLRSRYAIDATSRFGNVHEEGSLLYLRAQLIEPGPNGNGLGRFEEVTFVLGDQWVATLCQRADFHPFETVAARCQRRPSLVESPKALLRVLLQAANDNAATLVGRVADALEESTHAISQISEGFNAKGQELGVSDLSAAMRRLNDKEEVILRCIESLLTLARTVRYLSAEVDNRFEADLQELVTELAGDVLGTKEHAAFEHEKLRYLQSAVTNILNIKQNQIVKVFTIITAVFLPPTLIASFYGMNFTVMPELDWSLGFIYAILLALAAALLPLLYIKYRGWLR